ncbi:hypothetical protein OC844_007255, partial [Tilletia horrida]
MAIYIRRPRGRSLRAMRPEAVASHPLWDREVNQSEFLHRAQDWTFARRVGEEWRPLTAHDAHLILTNPAADGAHSFAPKEQLERQVDLRLECAHRHPQVFATLTMSGMRSHLRTHDHPKAEPERTAFELFQGIVNLLLTTLAMGGILFAAAHSVLTTQNSLRELRAQRCADPIPLAETYCASLKTGLTNAAAVAVMLSVLSIA